MEITCTRCHQSVPADSCFCPACGLPQLVYSTEDATGALPAERGGVVLRDANSVEWRSALRACLLLAVPAGLLSCSFSPVGLLGLFWIAAAAAWAVSLYLRSQRGGRITTGAGARIGLVAGLLAAWLAFSATGAGLFAERFLLHQSAAMDQEWKAQVEVNSQATERVLEQLGVFDRPSFEAQKQLELTPNGHAGFALLTFCMGAGMILLFAAGGGALSARLITRARRPQG